MSHAFNEQEVKRLCEASLHFGVTLVKYLGQGGYNMVWEVKRAGAGSLVLRMSIDPTSIPKLEAELDLYRTMHSLHIGMPFLDGFIFSRSNTRGILAILTEKGKGTLDEYLKGDIVVRASPVEMAKSAIDAIRHSATCDFFFGDMKTENMLVTDDKVYMADFDPKYCQKDTWIASFCQDKGIVSNCNLDSRSASTLRDLLTRVMVFQLHFFANRNYKKRHAVEFTNALYEHGIEKLKLPHRREIRIGQKVVHPMEVLEHLLETLYTNVLNKYMGRYKAIEDQNFQNAISNFLTLQSQSSSQPSPRLQVIHISSNSESNSKAKYTRLRLHLSSSSTSTSTKKRKRSSTPRSGHALRPIRSSGSQSPVHPLQWKGRRK